MRYPYQVLLVVADADRGSAMQLALAELGPERGADWYSIELRDGDGATYWASCSALTEAHLATIAWFQGTEQALGSLVVVVKDRRNGEELDVAAELERLGLIVAREEPVTPEP